jgi:hypothetical protein
VTSDPDLSDVSCPEVDWCLAVGASVGYSLPNWAPLAQIWDGSTWTVVDTSDLVEPDTAELDLGIRLDEVSCRSTTDCVATTQQFVSVDGGADIYADVHRWDGTDWYPLLDDPDQEFHEAPKDVDCAVGGMCIITVDHETVAYFWDGATFVETGHSDADDAASCAGLAFCVRMSDHWPTAEHWDGTAWTPVPVPVASLVGAVDCVSASRCVAVGSLDDLGGPMQSLAWDGTAWTALALPVSGNGAFSGLSCVGQECVALGTTAAGDRLTLGLVGSTWYALEATPGGADTVYEGLSCVGESCLAVGWSGPANASTHVAAEYDWSESPPPTSFVVDVAYDAVDASPGDGVCDDGTGHCSLRAAIMESNADADIDEIEIEIGIDPALSITGPAENQAAAGDLDILDELLITGNGATIDGNGVGRVVDNRVGPLTLEDLTITGGSAGGIVTSRSLQLAGSVVSGNGGPGIEATGPTAGDEISVVESEISGNATDGILAVEVDDIVVTDSAISGNGRRGVDAEVGDLVVTRSTIQANGWEGIYSADKLGLVVDSSTIADNEGSAQISPNFTRRLVRIVNSTFSADTTVVGGSRIHYPVEVIGSTMWTSSGASGDELFRIFRGAVVVRGSILDGEVVCAQDGDLEPFSVTSEGYNIVSDLSCGFTGPGDVEGTDPLLGPLADNGGPTWTRQPGPLSPAIDAVLAGTAGLCDGSVPTDQRGVSRPQGSGCDIGAVEQ